MPNTKSLFCIFSELNLFSLFKTEKISYHAHMKDQIEAILEEIRPRLEVHGGGVEFVDYKPQTQTVAVSFRGACENCPLAEMTLKMVVAAVLQERLPAIQKVVAVKSHEQKNYSSDQEHP